jgi:hypothetical protein
MLPAYGKRPRMEQDIKKQIKEIIGDLQCPELFCCLESGFEFGCKARDVGVENYLACFEESDPPCWFVEPFGNKNYCHCPIRIHICKKLGK